MSLVILLQSSVLDSLKMYITKCSFRKNKPLLSQPSCLIKLVYVLILSIPCVLLAKDWVYFSFTADQSIPSAFHSKYQLTNFQSYGHGDCDAIGPRKPEWMDEKSMIDALPEFSKLYMRRIIQQNQGGMRFSHSFALWFMLRRLEPAAEFVIESGSHKGHSAWIIRQALPNAKYISISPENPLIKVSNAIYLTGKQFLDFKAVNWSAIGVDTENAVVVFDDHQSADIRILNQGRNAGFHKFIYEDNFYYLSGDSLSMRWLCEVNGESEWPGYVLRNFGKQRQKQTWEEHMNQANDMGNIIKHYMEFPPLIDLHRYGFQKTTQALVESQERLKGLVGPIADDWKETHSYHYICYVEIF